MVIVKYYRYKRSFEKSFDTLRQAMTTSFSWWQEASAAVYEIVDGDTVYDIAAIDAYWKQNFGSVA